MTTYEEAARSLRDLPGAVWGTGATASEIHAAEVAIGGAVPADYARFLREFGWAEFAGYEIAGLGVNLPIGDYDFVAETEWERTYGGLPPSLATFYNNGFGDRIGFQVASIDVTIYRFDHERRDLRAESSSFAGFLLRCVDDARADRKAGN